MKQSLMIPQMKSVIRTCALALTLCLVMCSQSLLAAPIRFLTTADTLNDWCQGTTPLIFSNTSGTAVYLSADDTRTGTKTWFFDSSVVDGTLPNSGTTIGTVFGFTSTSTTTTGSSIRPANNCGVNWSNAFYGRVTFYFRAVNTTVGDTDRKTVTVLVSRRPFSPAIIGTGLVYSGDSVLLTTSSSSIGGTTTWRTNTGNAVFHDPTIGFVTGVTPGLDQVQKIVTSAVSSCLDDTAFFTIRVLNATPITTSYSSSTISSIPGSSTLTITGNNFNVPSTANHVFFGPVRANIRTGGTSTSMTVDVPLGATHSRIEVYNDSDRMAGYNHLNFHPLFETRGFDSTTLLSFKPSFQYYLRGHASQRPNPAIYKPYGVEFADLNNDGAVDMIVTGSGFDDTAVSNTARRCHILIYKNLGGTGNLNYNSFATPDSLVVNAYPINSKVVDLDNDGDLDIITACSGGASAILKNTSTGSTISFATKIDVLGGIWGPVELATGDYNKDGRMDIAVCGAGYATAVDTSTVPREFRIGKIKIITNLIQPGTSMTSASFRVDSVYAFNPDIRDLPTSIASGDLNNDGYTDLVVSNHNGRELAVFINLRTATYGTRDTFSVNPIILSTAAGASGYPMQVKIADLDNNGTNDILVANADSATLSSSSYEALEIYKNNFSGGTITASNFTRSSLTSATSEGPVGVAVADLDADGKLDVVVTNAGVPTSLSILKNTTTGSTISFSRNDIIIRDTTLLSGTPGFAGAVGLAIGDLDKNTVQDIALVTREGNAVQIFRHYPTPQINSISGNDTVCLNSTTTYTSTLPQPLYETGHWTISDASIATIDAGSGALTGLSVGSATVTFYAVSLFDTTFRTKNIFVKDTARGGIITGVANVCPGGTTTLTSLLASGRGVWSSTNTSVATIDTGGVVRGIIGGTTIISYTVTNSCNTNAATHTLNVYPAQVAGTITGLSGTYCVGNTDTAIASGFTADTLIYISSNTSRVTINRNTGIMTAVASGTATILQIAKSANGCANDTTRFNVSVTTSGGPATTISGATSTCVGTPTTLTASATGGVWTSSNTSVANIDATTGVITPGVAGTATITYTIAFPCRTDNPTRSFTVNALPTAGSISGSHLICDGTTPTYTNTTAVGTLTWTSSNTTVATIGSTSGILTALNPGFTVVTSTATNGCGTATDTQMVNVAPVPNAGTITGAGGRSTVCLSSGTLNTLALSTSGTGGTWSTSDASLATVTSAGLVTAVASGSPIISYSVTTACSTDVATFLVSVTDTTALPTTVSTSAATLCAGRVYTLTASSTISGTWSTGTTTIATISNTGTNGILTARAPGVAVVRFRVTNACGTSRMDYNLTINDTSATPAIAGPSIVYVAGATITLTNTRAGGIWSMSNASATITSGGVVAGVSPGFDTAFYTIHGGCVRDSIRSKQITILSTTPPTVSSITPINQFVDSLVTINGSNFNVIPANNIVRFGATSVIAAKVVSASTTQLVVVVPVGAQTGFVTVTDRFSKLSENSTQIFNPLYDTLGFIPSTITNWQTPLVINAGALQPWSVANADLDLDGKTDIIVTGSGSDNVFIYRNISPDSGSVDNQTFAAPVLIPGRSNMRNVKVADINGDGKPEIIATSVGTASVLVWRNRTTGAGISTSSFSTWIDVNDAPIVVPSEVAINDFDNDGKLDIAVVGSGYSPFSLAGSFVILKNNIPTSDTSIIRAHFERSVIRNYPVGTSLPVSIATADIDGDNLVDVAITDNATRRISLYKNSSTGAGVISFESNFDISTAVGAAGMPYSVRFGNMDNSGRLDMVVCVSDTLGGAFTVNQVNTYQNTATAGSFSASTFTLARIDTTAQWPIALALGDYNADGRVDIAVSTGSNSTNILKNTTTGSTITMVRSALTVGNNQIGVDFADFDGNSVPELIVAGGVSNTIAIFRNNPIPDTTPITFATAGLDSVCIGGTTTAVHNPPTLAVGHQYTRWKVSNTSIATIDLMTGVITGIAPGIDTVIGEVVSLYDTNRIRTIIRVLPNADAGTVTGAAVVCVTRTTLPLSTTVTGGTWASSNTARATVDGSGVVTGVAPGTVNIYYIKTNSCPLIDTATRTISVEALPFADTIGGANNVCVSSTSTYTNTVSGGRWHVTNALASIDSTSGLLTTGTLTGIDTVYYVVSTTNCGNDTSYKTISIINASGFPITDARDSICVSNSDTMYNAAVGGSWSSSNTAVATVHPTLGIVTGVSAGVATITYRVLSCATTIDAFHTIRIKALPFEGNITGDTILCVGVASTYNNTTAAGETFTWSSPTTGFGTLSAPTPTSVTLTTTAPGTYILRYTSSTSFCGSNQDSLIVNIYNAPDTGTLSVDTTRICEGSTTTVRTSSSMAGTWSSSNTAVASINPTTGSLSAVAPGDAIISFTVSTPCDTQTATIAIHVDSVATSNSIAGADSVCTSGTITKVASGGTSGTWSTTSSLFSVSTSGVVTAGTTTGSGFVYYTSTRACNTVVDSDLVVVGASANAGTISGPDSVCAGATITLTNTGASHAGSWSSENTSIANITSVGVVNGVSAGVTNMVFTVTSTLCGTDTVQHRIVVNSALAIGTVVGRDSVCSGSTITLVNIGGLSGGTWSSSDTTIAIVGSTSGIVTGRTAGTVSISYNIVSACGNGTADTVIYVNALPDTATISGDRQACAGSSSLDLDVTSTLGTWSSSNAALATVSGSGIVFASSTTTGGSLLISYTIASAHCGSFVDTHAVRIDPVAYAGVIYGPDSVCVGTNITLNDTLRRAGSFWATSDASIASVNTSGLVRGISAGTATIMVISNTANCGTDTARFTIRVIPNPVAGTIAGPTSVCERSTITLTNTTSTNRSANPWSSSDATIATVSSTGVVTGVAAGSVRITYTSSTGCATPVFTTYNVTVNPLPRPGTLTVPGPFCLLGGTMTITTDGATGGVFRSVNPAIATINPTSGVATPVSVGRDSIFYIHTTVCGVDSSMVVLDVITVPATPSIIGPDTICSGTTATFSDSLGRSASWSHTAASTVSVLGSTSGRSTTVRGVGTVAGFDTLIVTNINACGTTSRRKPLYIKPLPNPGTIVGPDRMCLGTTIFVSNSITGGTWASSNTAIAFVASDGSVVSDIATGSAGTVTISYTVPSNGCGTSTATFGLTVFRLPLVDSVTTGTSVICQGTSTTLRNTSTRVGLFWSSSDTTIARVTSTGTVTGLLSDSVMIFYNDTNYCGTAQDTFHMFILPGVADSGAIVGVDSLCIGDTARYVDTVAGGVWSTSNTAIATIDATGLVRAISQGTVTINYKVSSICDTSIATYTLKVNKAPVLTVTPQSVCDSVLFSYNPATRIDSAGATWYWVRPLFTNIANTRDSGTGVINEYLDNTTNVNANVTYTIAVSKHGCTSTALVGVTVKPTPYLVSKLFDTVCSGSPYVYLDSISTGATTGATWVRAVVPHITNAAGNGVHAIRETLINDTITRINVPYVYTLNANGCTNTATLLLTVNPRPGFPQITTHSDAFVCNGTMYQNFGSATPPPTGIVYTWTATGGHVWATGSTRQYALVNFDQSGRTDVYLEATLPGYSCAAKDSFTVSVSNALSDKLEIVYFNGDLIVLSNDQDTYQWGYDNVSTLDSSLFPYETNQNLRQPSLDLTNKYYFVLTSRGDCKQKTYYNTPVAIRNVNAISGDVKVYPNPTNQFLNIEITNTIGGGKYRMDIVNMMGQKVSSYETMDQSATLDVSMMSTGMYFVDCYKDGVKFSTVKFIKN